MTSPTSDEAFLAPLHENDAPENDAPELQALRERLARSAADAGLLDVAYRTVDTPVGTLLLAATERGVARVAFAREDHDLVLADLAARISPRILQAPGRLELAVRELEEYFDGRRQTFDVALDLSLAAGFRRDVLVHLPEVRYGTTVSYTTLALRSGRPLAVRAAASACARNPLPVLLPCHRIVRSDSSLGGYIGGLEAKQALLTLETSAGTGRA